MKFRALLLVLVVALQITAVTALGSPKQPTPAAEIKFLQGTWNLVTTETQGQTGTPPVVTQWIFVGQKLYLRTGKKTVLQGVITVSPGQKPKAINVAGKAIPPMLGIYEFSGGKLKVAAAPNDRPADFKGEGAAVVSVLERAKTSHPKHHGRALL
jgi:uncharacterized protein (TIGR03067 family)